MPEKNKYAFVHKNWLASLGNLVNDGIEFATIFLEQWHIDIQRRMHKYIMAIAVVVAHVSGIVFVVFITNNIIICISIIVL